MNEFSKVSVWELLKIMQRKVKENASILKKNVNAVEKLKKKYGDSSEGSEIINSLYKQNFELTKENTSLLELHNLLYKFYNNFRALLLQSKSAEEMTKLSTESWEEYRETCISKSITGDLPLNKQHPFINDNEFLSELLGRCQQLEMYEKCSEIVDIQSKARINN